MIVDPNEVHYWCWLQPKGWVSKTKKKKRSSKATSPSKPWNCPFGLCKVEPTMQHLKVEESFFSLMRKSVTLMVLIGFQSCWHDKNLQKWTSLPGSRCPSWSHLQSFHDLPSSLPDTLASSTPKWIFEVINKNGGATDYRVFFFLRGFRVFCARVLNFWWTAYFG